MRDRSIQEQSMSRTLFRLPRTWALLLMGLAPLLMGATDEEAVNPDLTTVDEIQLVWLAGLSVLALVIILFASRQMVKDLVNQHLSKVRRREARMLEVTAALSQELQLDPLLEKVISTAFDTVGNDNEVTEVVSDAHEREGRRLGHLQRAGDQEVPLRQGLGAGTG